MSRTKRRRKKHKELGGWYDICSCRRHRIHFPDWMLRLGGMPTGKELREKLRRLIDRRRTEGEE